ncbi:MAG: 2'-5' RNA ligase [uncultured Chloroflexia bacterium]|uniref:RNA 2',3'-cyclic phosphodiesterase n=1 Tax=uncultured Chloroflexia bacterium TaxID=1672391 RepID=A0A6J4L311_9CHLR|nr:MAG: 2'-5' RNA ligase [uncultured Chloroflexia bacterium]
MRLFIALNLPAELRARIATDVLAPLRAQLPGVRWVREETMHITLAFLGERSAAAAHEAHAAVQKIAASRHPFGVSLTGLGVFPSPARPRVVWLGLADAAPMHELYGALGRDRVRLELPAEERAYHPHVTLGRVPPHAGREVSARLAPALSAVQFEALVTFSSLDLMHSELTPKGPRYTTLLAALLTRLEDI